MLELAVRHACGRFHLDACANASNHVVRRWLGPGSPLGVDALERHWALSGVSGVRVFMNPPWSRVAPFVEHALRQVAEGHVAVVVMVLPCRAETRWWRALERPPIGVTCFRDDVDGRLAYIDPKRGRTRRSPPEATTVWVARATLRASDFGDSTPTNARRRAGGKRET